MKATSRSLLVAFALQSLSAHSASAVEAAGGNRDEAPQKVMHAAPAALFDDHLATWKLTLPIDLDQSSTGDEIKQPRLATYSDEYFKLNDAGTGVLFTTPINGIRTSNNTKYARTELREVYTGPDAVGRNYWPCTDTAAKAREMHIEQSVIQSTTNKPQIGIGQIHDATSDNMLIKYMGPAKANGTTDTGKIKVNWNNNANSNVLDSAYKLGDLMSVDVSVSSSGLMKVAYKNLRSGVSAIKSAQMMGVSGGGCFFKAGNYIQDCVDSAYSFKDVMGKTTSQTSCDSKTPTSNAEQRSIVEIRKLTLR